MNLGSLFGLTLLPDVYLSSVFGHYCKPHISYYTFPRHFIYMRLFMLWSENP